MKQALIIGSTVADVTVRLPHLPVTGQDVIVESQSMSLGGCAYNVSEILRQSGVPYTLFSPVGTGIYGNYVREHLKRKQIPILIPTPAADNGCCYCFVEESGERTFAALHGAEYRFERQWFSLAESLSVGSVYVCGLELEEDTGGLHTGLPGRSPGIHRILCAGSQNQLHPPKQSKTHVFPVSHPASQ